MPMFTKRHYEALADALSNAFEENVDKISDTDLCAGTIVGHLIAMLMEDNPNFNPVEFGIKVFFKNGGIDLGGNSGE